MMGKIVGATMIIVSCGAFGYSICASHKRSEASLRQLIAALDYMQCELQYRLTPLPDLCTNVGREQKGSIGKFFIGLARELESQICPEVSSCVRAALAETDQLPKSTIKALEMLGSSLGRFDMDGQLLGLEQVRQFCREEVDKLAENRDVRLRSYQTLGLCAGAALAILFV